MSTYRYEQPAGADRAFKISSAKELGSTSDALYLQTRVRSRDEK